MMESRVRTGVCSECTNGISLEIQWQNVQDYINEALIVLWSGSLIGVDSESSSTVVKIFPSRHLLIDNISLWI